MCAVERRPVNMCLCFAWFVLAGDERNELTRVALDSRVGVTVVELRHCEFWFATLSLLLPWRDDVSAGYSC